MKLKIEILDQNGTVKLGKDDHEEILRDMMSEGEGRCSCSSTGFTVG